ncbi:MAG: DUF2807 domain-containing protein [Flavobacteriales bacterium]|nr:DUF2807 domain-containing protein [Flavobacteriales bacterium]
MRPNRTIALLSLSTLVLSACHKDEIHGSGVISTEYRYVAPFTNVQVDGPIHATVRYAPMQQVAVRADVVVLPMVRTQVVGNTLVLYLADGQYDDDFRFEVTVEVPYLSRLTQNGPCPANLSGFYNLGQLEVINNGVGDITLAGQTTHLQITQHGVGRINAQAMVADTCEAGLTGVGSMEVRVNDLLYGYLNGVGSIYYHGTPVVDVTDTGIGNVIGLD